MFILILVMLISGFISSNPVSGEDIKINKKISGEAYKLQELKNDFLKEETKKTSVITVRTESTGMSKFPATMIGVGAGLVVGTATGFLIGSNLHPSDSEQQGWDELGGAVIGGLSGLILGGVTGYILGK